MSIVLINIAGFFSNFLKVLDWKLCQPDKKIIPYFIDRGYHFRNNYYLDTNIYPEKQNIWYILFETEHEFIDTDILFFDTEYPTSGHPFPINIFHKEYIFCLSSIYSNEHFDEIRRLYNNIFKELKWTPFLTQTINSLKLPNKTLAAMIRAPVHYQNVDNNFFKEILTEIDILIKDYDYLYLFTQVKEYQDIIINKYQNRVLYLKNKNMVENFIDWTVNDTDYKKECIDCFLDVYLASTCDFLIGGSSNMMLGALFINPKQQFKIFDCLKDNNGY